MICSLAYGKYEEQGTPSYAADLIKVSLAQAAGDPYIVVPAHLYGVPKLPLRRIEQLLSSIVQVAEAPDLYIRHHALQTLAGATNSWSTMDPSQLTQQNFSISLLSIDLVRRTLLSALKESRSGPAEKTGLAILDNLRTADFRELYPAIAEGLPRLKGSRVGTCVQEIMQAVGDIYPSRSYAINEKCELLVYEQFANRKRGAGGTMERIYGPKLRYAPPLAHLLKKGVFQVNYARFQDWYPGEDEPR